MSFLRRIFRHAEPKTVGNLAASWKAGLSIHPFVKMAKGDNTYFHLRNSESDDSLKRLLSLIAQAGENLPSEIVDKIQLARIDTPSEEIATLNAVSRIVDQLKSQCRDLIKTEFKLELKHLVLHGYFSEMERDILVRLGVRQDNSYKYETSLLRLKVVREWRKSLNQASSDQLDEILIAINRELSWLERHFSVSRKFPRGKFINRHILSEFDDQCMMILELIGYLRGVEMF